MTRSIGKDLPARLISFLDGSDVEGRAGSTIVLATQGAEGWPLVALLSVGEVLAVGPRHVQLALWQSSSTTRELTRVGLTTMSLVLDGSAWDVRLRCARGDDIVVDGGGRIAAFRCLVEDVLEDRVGYAELVEGIRFRIHDPDRVVPRWQRTIAALRDLEPHPGTTSDPG